MRGNAAPGWYPDPSGGPGRKYWDGAAWHDAVPAQPKPTRQISTKALLIAAAVFIAVVVVGNILETRHEENKQASKAPTTRTAPSSTPTTKPPTRTTPTTPRVSPEQLNPATYQPVTERQLALIRKDPYAHYGESIIIYGKVVQFDTATGTSAFRADVAAEPGSDHEDVVIEAKDPTILADVVEGDALKMGVEVAGAHTYSTQMGGERTVPLFDVYIVEHWQR